MTLTSIGVNRLQDVDITTTYGDDKPVSSTSQDTIIDIALQNAGGSPALIRSIDFNFDFAEELENCNPGRGPVVVTAKYDLHVPLHLTSEQFKETKNGVLFQVAPNNFDRLAVTVGPERVNDGDRPWVYGGTVTLHFDAPQPELTTTRVALMSPVWGTAAILNDMRIPRADQEPCLRGNIDRISRAIKTGGTVSPQLTGAQQSYQDVLDKLAG